MRRSAVVVVGVGLVLATIAGGATSFLKRIGLLDRTRYEEYWRVHCGKGGAAQRPFGLGRRCLDARPGPLAPEHYARDAPYFRFAFDVQNAEIPLKLAKDVFVSFFVLGSLALLVRGQTTLPRASAWPFWALLLRVVVALVAAVLSRHWLSTLLELRGLTFLAVTLVAAWATSAWGLRTFARALLVLAVVQLLLVPLELLWAMPISGYALALALPNRVAGMLVKPNTLGVLAAATVAASEAFETEPRWRRTSWVVAILLVASAGSATGWIILGALGLYRARALLRTALRVAAVAVAALVFVAALPTVVGRPDVYDSLLGARGRLGALRLVVERSPLWLGEGLGPAEPLADGPDSLSSLAGARPQGMDSTLVMLIQKLGLPAALLFYLVMAAAWRSDESTRPLLLSLGLASLTLNLVFAFPMNFLLGLAWARGLAAAGRRPESLP